MMPAVACPDCATEVALPAGVRPGDLVECPGCAGLLLRIGRAGGSWTATLAHRVSCPRCGRLHTLPEGAKAGDTVDCCGRQYRLTVAWGAFAAEEPVDKP